VVWHRFEGPGGEVSVPLPVAGARVLQSFSDLPVAVSVNAATLSLTLDRPLSGGVLILGNA